MTRLHGVMGAGIVALALSGSVGRGMSHREIDEVRATKARKEAVPLPAPDANLPGETNRQFAARMRAPA